LPIYEFLCEECNTRFEKLFRGITEEIDFTRCPKCDRLAVKLLPSDVKFTMK